jgi:hypothetical protein
MDHLGQDSLRQRWNPYCADQTKELKMDRFSMAYALLATQQALLGIVTPELMAVEVSLSFEDEKLLTTFYFDQKVSEEILELCSAASTEVSANLCCFSENRFAYLQANDKISPRGQLAYLRLQPSGLDNEPSEFLSREIVHSEEKPALFIHPINGESIDTSYQLIHKTVDHSKTLPAIPKTANIDIPLPTFVELALQKALLGRVSRQLRAMTTDYNEVINPSPKKVTICASEAKPNQRGEAPVCTRNTIAKGKGDEED